MRARSFLCIALALGTVGGVRAQEPVDEARHGEARKRLVREIRRDVQATSSYLGREALDPKVLSAIGRVPRHRFVPKDLAEWAYDNRPLAIGHGQTISQPYIVAIMTDLLDLEPGDRVLEVGTGSGYQAAILGELVERVYSLEIIDALAERSAGVLSELGYDNVVTRRGDGYYGWPGEGPFDAIIVTAAAGHVPPPLIEQLAAPGRMMIPVGSRFMVQQLVLVQKSASGEISLEQILPVRFVPLTGDHD
jgi:protein-L-isoaspartate(D-aspartate) O-methyltransferase